LSIENLIKKINENEINIQNKIIEQTSNEISKIEDSFNEEFCKFKNFEDLKNKEKIESYKQKKEIDLEILKRKNFLELKRNVLDSVFNEFIENLKKWDVQKYIAFIKKCLNKIENISKDSKIIIGNSLLFLPDYFYEEIKKYIFEKYNLNENEIDIIFSNEIICGVIYIEDKINIDLSFNAIISDMKTKYEIELSNILFSNQNQ
jgi:vacuolar-type H+-ATPase subunit E/Vma4